jgi:hypothetical protein
MKNPTEQEIADAYQREFPGCHIGTPERAFLAFIHVARSHVVGFGWMRQAIGLAWKLADPVGYVDDDQVIKLYAPDAERAERERITAIIRARREQYRVDGWQAQADAMSLLLDKIEKLP